MPRIHETSTQRKGVEVEAVRTYEGGIRPYVFVDDSAFLTPAGARRFARTLIAAAAFAEKRIR